MDYFSDKYTAIRVQDLRVGMDIDYDIYYEKQGHFLLLCRNAHLTQELIERFIHVTSPSFTIYIPNERYHFEFAPKPVSNRSPVEVSAAAYREVKTEMADMLTNITKTGQISAESTSTLTNTVLEQVKTVEASIVIQHINTIRKTDEYLHTHSINVSLLNGLMGKWLRLDDKSQEDLVEIGLLHDVGKLKIPPEILNKPAKLTPEEFKIIQSHPLYSLEMLNQSGIVNQRILRGVVQHHEKGNGQGYPQGLSLNDIDVFARITSISDVYDAMVAKRVYKDAHSPFEILDWFSKGCYSDLDISYVRIFMDAMTEELKGKQVRLSDGTVAEVLYIHPSNFQYPIVKRGGEVINTSAALNCVSMYVDQ